MAQELTAIVGVAARPVSVFDVTRFVMAVEHGQLDDHGHEVGAL
jgi:hypothetical protein